MNLTISSFGTILTVLGVVFGLLQYYFNRHEDKVQQKYNMNFSLIVFPIKKFSFDEFVKFLGEQEKYKTFTFLVNFMKNTDLDIIILCCTN